MPVGVISARTRMARTQLLPHALYADPRQVLVFLQATWHDILRKTLPFQKAVLIDNANPSPL